MLGKKIGKILFSGKLGIVNDCGFSRFAVAAADAAAGVDGLVDRYRYPLEIKTDNTRWDVKCATFFTL